MGTMVRQTGMDRLLAAIDDLADAKDLWESGELSYREYRAAWDRVREERDAVGLCRLHGMRLQCDA